MKRLFWLCLFSVFFAPAVLANVSLDYDAAVACAAATSCSHTNVVVANQPNRVMLAYVVQHAATSQVSSCVFNTTETMTHVTGGANGGVTMYADLYILKSPSVTTATVLCSYGSSIGTSVGVYTAYTVDQTTTLRSTVVVDHSGGSEDPIASNITTVAGELAIMVMGVRSQTCENTQTGYSIGWDDSEVGGSTRVSCAISKTATTTSTDMSLDVSAAAAHIGIALSLIEAPAGGTKAILFDQRRR